MTKVRIQSGFITSDFTGMKRTERWSYRQSHDNQLASLEKNGKIPGNTKSIKPGSYIFYFILTHRDTCGLGGGAR